MSMIEPAASGAPPLTPASRRPALLTFFAFAAIAVGAMKGFGAASSAAAPRLLSAQQSFMRNLGLATADTPVARAQAETQRQIQAILTSHQTLTRLSAGGAAIVAFGLLLGGIGCLSLRQRARPLLIAAFAAGLAMDLALARPTIGMQVDLANANAGMINRIVQESRVPGAGQAPSWVGTMSTAMGSIGIAMAISLMAAYALFFVGGLVYLTRPQIARLFQTNT